MAGEVAHDFNNTLSGILARAQPFSPTCRTPMSGLAAHDRAVALEARGWSGASRFQPHPPLALQPVDLTSSSRDRWSARSRWTSSSRRGISARSVRLGPVPPRRDMAELRQVSPRSPSMRSTRCRRAELTSGPEPRVAGVLRDRRHRHRHDEQVRLHIFDPFFTTTREGRLRLSGARDRGPHGGEMKVESEPARAPSSRSGPDRAGRDARRPRPSGDHPRPRAAARPSPLRAPRSSWWMTPRSPRGPRELLSRHG